MMPKYGLLVVEGPHDVEFVYRLLSPSGLARVQLDDHVDPFLKPLIPRIYPPDGDLLKRVSVPLFLQSATHAVAILSAIGDTRLVQTLEENAAVLDVAKLTGIGIILDSDSEKTARERYNAIRDRLLAVGYVLPDAGGSVRPEPPRVGAFVLPDNLAQGTLEDILLDCAQHTYPTLLATAMMHVEAASVDVNLAEDDLRELRKPAGRNKATIGSVASILRPGRAIQVSLQDNRWLRDTALDLPRVHAVRAFLGDCLELK
jgi:hypothetical protein